MTELHAAVRELLDFLGANASKEPERKTEWPLTLECRDQPTADELSRLLNRLEELTKPSPSTDLDASAGLT